jgi:hypothetical protein
VNLNDIESIKANVNDFLAKENSTLDKYDLLTKKVWLTIGKPEPQAGYFVKTLKNLIDTATKSEKWKVYYKTK